MDEEEPTYCPYCGTESLVRVFEYFSKIFICVTCYQDFTLGWYD